MESNAAQHNALSHLFDQRCQTRRACLGPRARLDTAFAQPPASLAVRAMAGQGAARSSGRRPANRRGRGPVSTEADGPSFIRAGPRPPAPTPLPRPAAGRRGGHARFSRAPRRRYARRPTRGISFAPPTAERRPLGAQNRGNRPGGPATRIVRYRPPGPPP